MSLSNKFAPESKFKKLENYKLLPIRFSRLDKQRFVITNIVGEHFVLTQSELSNLIRKEGKLPNHILSSLYAKHMIYNGESHTPLMYTGLKYRTKIARLKNFTALHMVVTTLRCDYTCNYCQVSRQNLSASKDQYDMTQETADNVIINIFNSPSKAIKIEFQGGESLLNFDIIKYIVTKSLPIAKSQQRDLQFVIATNLSPLNDEILSFCKLHSIYISTSLDGPKYLHDKNRPKPERDGYDSTIEGINKIRESIGVNHVSALMTTAGRSLDYPIEIVNEYIEKGFNSIFLRPLSPYGFAVTKGHINRYDTKRWLEFYKKALDYIININKSGYKLIEQYSSLVLTKILTARDLGYVDLQSPTGAMISGIIYNYDGNVFASDEARMQAEMGHNEFLLGNVNKNSYEEIISNDYMLDAIDKSMAISCPNCHDCAFLPYCGSDPVYHQSTQNSVVGDKMLSGFCAKNMGVFKHLITLLEDSDEETKSILKSWARF